MDNIELCLPCVKVINNGLKATTDHYGAEVATRSLVGLAGHIFFFVIIPIITDRIK